MKEKRGNRAKNSARMYSADRPIKSKHQDVLERAKFAGSLADDLHSWDGDDSLVIGLYGAWGSGKTSVKNMLLEANHKRGRTSLRVVDFNPWQLSGTGGIPAAFFRELGLALEKEGPLRDVEKRAKTLNAYTTALMVMGTTTEAIGKVLPWTGLPGGPLVETIGKSFKSAGASTKEGAEALKAQKDAASKCLEDQKQDLAALLSRLPQPLLVVIDDIDRLTTNEILQIFQLVKANADFPRVIYLLVFEREVVAKALNEISSGKGTEFLEKIIQVGYHVPLASPAAVQRVLFDGLNKLLENTAASKHWDKHRWRDLYSDGISNYFRNLRHVYRFLASFSFHFNHYCSKASFEVNPVDLMGLETLRVFEPSAYERLPSAKSILTRYVSPNPFASIKQDTVDQTLIQITAAVPEEKRKNAKAILNILFPPVSGTFGDKHEISRHHQEWLREHRVCHPDLFDKYFTLSIADDDLSQAELEGVLAQTNNSNAFIAGCEALRKRGLLNLAFKRMDAYRELIPLEAMPSLIKSLCDMSDGFPERQPTAIEQMFEHQLGVYAWRLCYFGLKREPDRKKRFVVLNEAVTNSVGLALPFELVSLDERNEARSSSNHEFLLDEEDVQALKNVCVRKFHEALKNPTIRENPHLSTIFLRWSYWDAADKVKSLMSGQLRTCADALWLLTLVLQESHSFGQEHRVNYSISLCSLERFSDIAHVKALLAGTKSATLTKRESIAIREFQKALKRREDGLPDLSGHRSHDDPDEEIIK